MKRRHIRLDITLTSGSIVRHYFETLDLTYACLIELCDRYNGVVLAWEDYEDKETN